ncbi:MAG: hypothetical protein ACM3X7_05210 [Solirubrobacterales bacterium]
MNRKLILKLCALSIATTVGTSLVMTSSSEVMAASTSNRTTATYTSISKSKGENIKIINNDTFEIDGVRYSVSSISQSIKKDSIKTGSGFVTNSIKTDALRAGLKWLAANSTKIYNKLPAGLKKYFKIQMILKTADQFLSISDSFEDLLHHIFRELGVPETANWAITNIIMLASPF